MLDHARLRLLEGGRLDYSLCGLGLLVMTWSASEVVRSPWSLGLAFSLAFAVPLTVAIARFPMLLENRNSPNGIEIGFDSIILMFLLCTLSAPAAVLVWSCGVVATQVTSGKRLVAQAFNTGVGVLAGGAAAAVLHALRGREGSARELLAVAVAAATYFAVDYVVSAVSIAIDDQNSLTSNLLQGGVPLAIGCFVAFDMIGYLAAIVVRVAPWWAVTLLGVPLMGLLVAQRAVTRGREHSRRLRIMLDAAVRAQTLYESNQVVDALRSDARELLRLPDVEIRATGPEEGELGAQVQRGKTASWVVGPARRRARSTKDADQQALEALAAVASDAFARLQLTEDMVHFARHDPLTDLPNRGILQDRLAQALQVARRRENRLALLFIDLDGFKPVNDRFGHAAGDRVLVDVAERLRACVRGHDTVARIGGDEFAVLFEEVDADQVRLLCSRILDSLGSGMTVSGNHVRMSASVGIAFSEPDDTTESLLRHADLAMYEAKARGKSLAVEYDPGMGATRMRKLEMVDELRQAIEQGAIRVVYQPVVDANSGRIEGVEALARWRLAGADIAPDVFIRVAEENGLITALGERVLIRAAHDAVTLGRTAGNGITMSVNVSAQQLRDPSFIDVVRRAVAIMGDRLILEITEREGIGDDPVVHRAMERISALGVRFAIDDFGAGFSSIGYLRDVPAHIIKADAALSRNIDRDDRARLLLRSVAHMGHELGMDVVVEGIERESQLVLVREDVNAQFAQGYLMHRPMPLDNLIEVVGEDRAMIELGLHEAPEPHRPTLSVVSSSHSPLPEGMLDGPAEAVGTGAF